MEARAAVPRDIFHFRQRGQTTWACVYNPVHVHHQLYTHMYTYYILLLAHHVIPMLRAHEPANERAPSLLPRSIENNYSLARIRHREFQRKVFGPSLCREFFRIGTYIYARLELEFRSRVVNKKGKEKRNEKRMFQRGRRFVLVRNKKNGRGFVLAFRENGGLAR